MDTKKKGERKSARISDQNRTGRAAVGWSTEGPASMEEEEKQGEAMNVTSIKSREGEGTKSREGDSLSVSNDTNTVGLRGVGEAERHPQPFHVCHVPLCSHPKIFRPLLILHLILKGLDL